MPSPKKARKNRTASLKFELEYYRNGYKHIVGIDEAGRGPWAGPLMVGAVALPLDRADLTTVLRGVRDSKMMTPIQRDGLVQTIKDVSIAWGVGEASPDEISELGLSGATRLAVERSLALLMVDGFKPDCLFCDYMAWPPKWPIHQLSIVKGDQYSLSIAAGSVLAKVTRDAYMIDMAEEFPQYGFDKHKGYGTAEHLAALEKIGPCPMHRRNYRPVREQIERLRGDSEG